MRGNARAHTLPGAEVVWQRIVKTERALRAVVREVYVARFRERAAQRIEEALPERERENSSRGAALIVFLPFNDVLPTM